MAFKKARVLREVELNGQACKPNSVVLLDEKALSGFVQDGSVDANPAAVEYCEKELGAKAARPGKPAEAEAAAG